MLPAASKNKRVRQPESATIGGVNCVEVREEGEPPVYWAVHKGLFLLTVGEDSFRDLIEQLETDIPSWMKPVVKRLPVEQRGMFGYFDLNRVDALVGASRRSGVANVLASVRSRGCQLRFVRLRAGGRGNHLAQTSLLR